MADGRSSNKGGRNRGRGGAPPARHGPPGRAGGQRHGAGRSDEPVDAERLLSGRNPVREALEGSPDVEKVWLQVDAPPRFQAEMRSLARSAGVPVQQVPSARLERMVPGVNHQGVVALLSAVGYADFDEMLAAIAPDHETTVRVKPMLVLLDGIQDPHNLGAILRTAVAAGVAGAVVPERGSAPLGAAALKASAGMAHRIPVARVRNLREAILQLKERGYWVAGADGTGDTSCWDLDWDRPMALVIGSEGEGMKRIVAAECDHLIRIPMPGTAESLNASVAAGILMFAAVQARASLGPERLRG